LLEDEDEFEDFPVADWTGMDQDQEEKTMWDDDREDDVQEFSHQLWRELANIDTMKE